MTVSSDQGRPGVEFVPHGGGATITSRSLRPDNLKLDISTRPEQVIGVTPELELSIEDREQLLTAGYNGELNLSALQALGDLQRLRFGNVWVGMQVDGTIGIGVDDGYTTPQELHFELAEWVVFIIELQIGKYGPRPEPAEEASIC